MKFPGLLFLATLSILQAAPVAQKPPMGWNSFDSYGVYLPEDEAYRNVDAMVEMLKKHGYEYFVVDNGWFGEYKLQPGTRFPAEKHASDVNINEYGLLQPSKTYFPGGMKKLADYVHSKGVKFGLHVMRGIPRKSVERNTPVKGTAYRAADIADKKNICTWCTYNYGVDMDKPGAQEFYDSWIGQMAEWGVDFIKADDIVPFPREVQAMARAIEKSGRPIVFSLSPGDHVREEDFPLLKLGNMLRVTSDIWDDRHGLDQCFAAWKRWQGKAKPGFWLDMDMIPFGRLQLMSPPPSKAEKVTQKQVALAGKGYARQSQLTPDQMYTFITMRALAASPLMMGGALLGLDDFSLKLLTNREMIACNQNGMMGAVLSDKDGLFVAKTPEQNSDNGWIGIFNRNTKPLEVKLTAELLGLSRLGEHSLHDIWEGKNLKEGQEYRIASDGVLFIRYKKR